ncbi:hypothetical protein [Pseudomonas sp. EMN2]|uniref:hypothetical protein n=1 Tax=Pseudomonas sp. EMN2 TaxID=2615212 RepID=UPI00129AD4EF|nr:hypothetical protein [Pseudomonas sp. EMN2]
MELFRRFTIRNAQLVAAVLRSVETNRQAKQISLSFRAADNERAELRAIMTADEARDLHSRLGDALKSI